MNLLNEKIIQEFYDKIEEIDKSGKSSKQKVSSLKSVFNSLFRELTSEENFNFINYNSRIEYAISNYNFSNKTIQLIRWLKKNFYKILLKEKNAISDGKFESLASVLIKIINLISETEIPESLKHLNKIPESAVSDADRSAKPVSIEYCRCVVDRISGIKSGQSDKKHFFIYCASDEDIGNFSVRINSYHLEDFEWLNRNIKKYDIIGLHNLAQNEDYKVFFDTTPDTIIVLEPDFLIEASEIAECFHDSNADVHTYFVRKFLPSYSSLSAFKGLLVNSLFDAMILNPEVNPHNVIRLNILLNPLIALKFDSAKIAEISESIIESDYEVLKSVLGTKSSNNIRIEPSFVAPEYGITGRLDALSIPPDDPEKRNIVELKSGKEHNSSVWKNHKMQITAYNLLLKSVFGKIRKGSSFILYSGSKKSPYRNISVSGYDEKKVVSLRNKIVAELLNLSFNKFGFLFSLINENITIPAFHKREMDLYRKLIKEASDLEQKYYRHLLAFLLREYKCAKTGSNNPGESRDNGFAGLWLDSDSDKEIAYDILRNLELIYFDEDSGIIKFEKDNVTHNFREGDFALLYSSERGERDKFTKGEIMRGIVSEITEDTLVFTLRNKQIYNDFFSLNSLWNIEHDIVESNFWSAIRSLHGFLGATAEKKQIILGLRKPESSETGFTDIAGLSIDMNENIRKALKAKDYFLLQGPPGTGKTSTALINIVKHSINSKKNIVILAYTNRAVNEICTKLKENKIKFNRINSYLSQDFSLPEDVSAEKIAETLKNDLKSCNIFVSTVTSFNNKIDDLNAIFSFDTVIIDEASQITEAEITGIISRFNKFILIGDQNQLPSVVAQSEKDSRVEDSSLNSIGIINFNISYFERMYDLCRKKNWNECIGMLRSHYRMHSDIAELINHAYENKLIAASIQQKAPLKIYNQNSENALERALSASRTIFFGCEFEKTSKTNFDEATKTLKILNLLKEIYGNRFNPESVGVVTPWRAQIALIRSKISNDISLSKITIDTVERFQGSERDIIIISFAVYNSLQLSRMESLNIYKVDRKLLVALSRAREQVIILGNESVLNKSDNYRRILDIIKLKNGYYSREKSLSIFKT